MSTSVYGEIGSAVASRYVEIRATESNDVALDTVLQEFDVPNKRSLRAFLSSAKSGKVYVADVKASVGGASSVRKSQLVKAIAEKHGLDFETIESLEKANKGALEALLK